MELESAPTPAPRILKTATRPLICGNTNASNTTTQ